MCLIAFAWQAHPRYPLIVAGNRDEFFARPTAAAAWSPDGEALSGIDLRGGGTWMGVTRDGRFAALTNHRDPRTVRDDAPSRGGLCVDVLTNARPVEDTLAAIAADAARYNGFNLLAGCWGGDDATGLWIVASDASVVRPVEPGVHALSNARLDTPWPKVERTRRRLADAIAGGLAGESLTSQLFGMLADEDIAVDDALPSTGVTLAWERALSAAFIRTPDYGTRSSTVLLVDDRGAATFVERGHEPGAPLAERRFAFETVRSVSATRAS